MKYQPQPFCDSVKRVINLLPHTEYEITSFLMISYHQYRLPTWLMLIDLSEDNAAGCPIFPIHVFLIASLSCYFMSLYLPQLNLLAFFL